MQTASPVCGTKNFSSVRLYSAPQLLCTIVAIHANMRFGLSIFQPGSYALCHEPLPPPSGRFWMQVKARSVPGMYNTSPPRL
jgi:hypothetical protein